jgi:formate/nitrite transporter FocA (FNT family)
MVALGTMLALSSTASTGKIASIWLPVSTFFALALEHSIVNMFVIPTAMMLGADITPAQWLVWNQIPVTLGNIVGGAVLTGLLLHCCNPADMLGQSKPQRQVLAVADAVINSAAPP